jgi:glycine oxidase
VAAAWDVAVVGGGVVGCAVAYALARRGARVVLLERDRVAAGASYGAGGMLAPQVEAHGPGPLLRLGLASRDLFPALEAEVGPFDLDLRGIVRVAHTEAGAAELAARAAWQREQGLEARLLEPSEVRSLFPDLGSPPLAALWVPDGRLVPERLTRALALAAVRHGAVVREGVPVRSVRPGRVETGEGPVVAAHVVVSAGAWSADLAPVPVRPVKGQRVLVRHSRPLLDRVLWGDGCYLVPQPGGRVLIGATEEPEAGFDRRPTAAAVARLLARAVELVPALGEAEVLEAWAGLRPDTPDHLPLLGPLGEGGVWAATGHYRNGILLAPVTGERLAAALLEGEPLPGECLPDRFRG